MDSPTTGYRRGARERHTGSMTLRSEQVGGTRGFLPAVEGMRACAAMGVVLTHVAFQTGTSGGVIGRLLHRFDLAVAVFFALSGFLLWRGHAAAARNLRRRPATGHYLRSRLIRIMPGYLVAVIIILTLLPEANHASRTVWLANLTLTQVYVPLTLTAGLTQMWSLSVEVTFYLALPILAVLAYRLPVRSRVPVIAAVALASFGWGLLPIHTPMGVNFLNWPPAYASWFAAGMLLAEWTVSPAEEGRLGWPHRLARNPWAIYGIALVAYLISASPLAGPKDLVPATLAQFVVRTSMGAVVAWALLAPLVLDRPDARHRILGNRTMVTLGRWSYGLFVWHLAALVMVFPMVGTFMFNGDLIIVFILTTVLGYAMAAVSYALIESPCRNALRRWEYRRSGRDKTTPPPLDSSVTDRPEPAVAH
jgi:peptidoglycan/LPS O-acetylase OafA/YrhL